MKKQGWQIISTGPADHVTGGLEVLGKKAGSDGFYWELGAVISPTSFGAGAPAAGATSFSLVLFQEPDAGLTVERARRTRRAGRCSASAGSGASRRPRAPLKLSWRSSFGDGRMSVGLVLARGPEKRYAHTKKLIG